MDHINLIAQTLKPHLPWHGARLKFLALFLVALFGVKTVNLSHIATAFANNIQIDSNYKRLQRLVFNLQQLTNEFLHCVHFLSCT